MTIAGLQRCSLVDFPGHVAATVFTQGCNLCCPYCHNSELISCHCEEPLPLAEFWQFLDERRNRLQAVVITGGEPCEQPDLRAFLRELRSTALRIKLDTNGTHPEELEEIIVEGLVDYVALDVKAPLERYSEAAGFFVEPDKLRRSIALVRDMPVPGEFRTTVVPAIHSPDDLNDIARELVGPRTLYLQPFAPQNALTQRLRNSPACTREYLLQCQARCGEWLHTELRA